MFLTKHDLKLSYGIHLDIGATYVDRKLPAENLYWKGRTIYLPGAPGYIFMPIFADVLFRAGASLSMLLSDEQLNDAEKILHSAALLEHKQISWKEHIQQASMIQPHVSSNSLHAELIKYLHVRSEYKTQGFQLGTKFPSLNRADSYLLSITKLDINSFDLKLAIESWYALMTYFLIMDDLADIKEDLKNHEENVLLDAGLDQNGISIITEMIDNSIQVMDKINPVIANRIDHKKNLIDLEAIIRSIR
jgi:hypothetical protein